MLNSRAGVTTEPRLSLLVRREIRASHMRCHNTSRVRSRRVEEAVKAMYRIRPCFQCGAHGPCDHREPEVEIAVLSAREFFRGLR
jgi:hypothetical protein